MILKDNVLNMAVDIISRFEGSGYGDVTGDFDGAYLSIGLIQWNFGQGTLQPLFKAMFSRHEPVANAVMGKEATRLKNALLNGTEKQWALSIQSNNEVQEPYLTALKKLCNTPEFQSIQREFMGYYRDNAINMCKKYNLYTDRAFCLLFDVSVNNGSVKAPVPDNLSYINKMKFIAESAARQKGKWYQDSLSRKLCIINGGGVLHEDNYNFKFTDTSAFEDIVLMEELSKMFNDYANISDWAKEPVEKLRDLGIIHGDNLGNFNPKDPVSREAVGVLIFNLLKYLGKV